MEEQKTEKIIEKKTKPKAKKESVNVVEKVTNTEPSKKPVSPKGYIAAVRLRGGHRIDKKIKDTLRLLNLNNQHNLVIFENRPNIIGMLKIVKDYVTYGEISLELKQEIEAKKTEKGKNGKVKKFYRLHPPRGGFERKGIKTAYNLGGALGYRGEKINDLLKRMI